MKNSTFYTLRGSGILRFRSAFRHVRARGALFLPALFLLFSPALTARPLPPDAERFIDSVMNAGLAKGYYPGAQLLIGSRNEVMFAKNYGWQDAAKTVRVTSEELYDVASLTKIVATTFAVMRLYDHKRIEINSRVGDYIDDFRGTVIDRISVSQLLTHTSGIGNVMMYRELYTNAECGEDSIPLPLTNRVCTRRYPHHVGTRIYLCAEAAPDSLMLSREPRDGYRLVSPGLWVNPLVDTLILGEAVRSYKPEKRGRYLYSDLNFHILKMIVERITGEPLEVYTRRLFDELEMPRTGYRPLEWSSAERIVPTEDDVMFRRGPLRGYTHDELVAVSGHVGGSAGIFSRAGDLSHFCVMMLNRGRYGGRQVISEETVNLFTSSPLAPRKVYRGLGFDKRAPADPLYNGYGHTGYTGTMIWIDPARNVYMVFLSNRVHPTRMNKGLIVSGLRSVIWEKLKEAFPK